MQASFVKKVGVSMQEVLTGKTRGAEAFVRFGGLGERGKDTLGVQSSCNFYCDNGVLKTVCVTVMQAIAIASQTAT